MTRFIFLLLAVCGSVSGDCCNCESPLRPKEASEGANVVFSGQVLYVDTITLAQTFDTSGNPLPATTGTMERYLRSRTIYAARFRVDSNIKGASRNEEITIFTPALGATCGYKSFVTNQDFVVYADKPCFFLGTVFDPADISDIKTRSGAFWTSQCHRTTDDIQSELRALGQD